MPSPTVLPGVRGARPLLVLDRCDALLVRRRRRSPLAFRRACVGSSSSWAPARAAVHRRMFAAYDPSFSLKNWGYGVHGHAW